MEKIEYFIENIIANLVVFVMHAIWTLVSQKCAQDIYCFLFGV